MSEYAGDVVCSTAWKSLVSKSDSFLVDVRTSAEWAYVGLPDLSELQKDVILLEWQHYPTMSINPNFVSELSSTLEQVGGNSSTEIYFLCRSGVRSKSAAIAMTEIGYQKCYNLSGGFEGNHNEAGHRGHVNGWKADKLPWRQG